jgi:hypothetical protein
MARRNILNSALVKAQTASQHACLIESLRGRNDTENRVIIVAREIINAAVIYVVSLITHNERFRGIRQRIVSGAHRNIASGPLHCRISTRTFNGFATPRAFNGVATTRAFNCSISSPSFRISQIAEKNHDCRHKKNCNQQNTPS